LILVPVTVTDSRNGFVTGLHRENFRVFESRREQQLLFFSSEDTPVSVGIIFDVSESMSGKLSMARQAVPSFLRTVNPDDEIFLVAFNGRPTLVQDFASDSAQVQSRLMEYPAAGRTAVFDSVYMGLHHLRKARHGRRALLVFTDREENSSRYTRGGLKDLVLESDAQIHTRSDSRHGNGSARITTSVLKSPPLPAA